MDFSLVLCFLLLIGSVFCEDFKCPERGKVGELKVPNVLESIGKQTGYYATVEVISPTRNNLVHDYYDMENKVGFIDLEATIQDKMNRRYYYHSTNEKIVVQENKCTRMNLTKDEKIESIKDWFEPADIVASSDMFKDFIHFGPTGLMIYAHSISDNASYLGSELIDGRAVHRWFYCSNPAGPYIDFYFDVKTSLPYRFSFYYPEWKEFPNFLIVGNKTTVIKQVDSDSKYVYNFFTFKPLVISSADPIPYPLGYGCVRENTSTTSPLPDFSQIKAFTMDMEAIFTYPDGKMGKSTARIMKHGDVISYEITEGMQFVRSIELPPPLGLFEVDEYSGQCRYRTSNYHTDVKLVTRWPLNSDYNLLPYLVMKPSSDHQTIFIDDIPLGPFRVEEYRVTNFFQNSIDSIIDYYYPSGDSDDVSSINVPYKVVFTRDRNNQLSFSTSSPDMIEVTVIDYRNDNFDYEDRFDVSGCYEQPGAFTWFQLIFSNPWMNEVNLEAVKHEVHELLLEFIPITRIGQVHTTHIDSNVYATVKLHDSIHLIDTYAVTHDYKISSPTDIVQKLTAEDCEQLCSSTEACYDFSYCSNFDCYILAFPSSNIIGTQYNKDCNVYRRVWFGHELSKYVERNHLSSMLHVLQQIRNKVSSGQFLLNSAYLSAEDLFIVSGPDEIGDISQEVHRQGSFRPVKGEDFPLVKTESHFNEAQFKIEKGSLTECFMACLNDDDCNTLSYCVNKNKECILSGVNSTTLDSKLEDKTSHADGCNIYEKSFMNLFSEFPGKSLVLDAVSTISNVIITDCAKLCAQAKDFNCESFDYCSDNNRNESVCYLHVNHIETDTAHEINRTNWKFAENGCTHFSKKSDRDYEHKVGFALKDNLEETIVGTFSHLSLEHCASKCNADPNCFTLEFCEKIGYDSTFDSSFSSSTCTLTNLKSTSVVNQPQFFEESKDPKKICSIYINHMKISAKDKTAKHDEPSPSTMKSNYFSLVIGSGTVIFILALVGGVVGFTFAFRKGLI